MSLMDSDDLDHVLSESEETSSSDETNLSHASSSISLQSRVRKGLCLFRAKLKKVKFIIIRYSI